MKKPLFILLTALTMIMPAQADEYADAFRQFMHRDTTNKNQLCAQLGSFRPEGMAEQEWMDMILEYTTSQGIDDMTEYMLPYFRKSVSIEDLQAVEAIMTDARYREIEQRTQQFLAEAVTSQKFTSAFSNLIKGVQLIADGKQAKLTKPDKKISKSYIQAYEQYYEISGTKQAMESTFASILNAIEQKALANDPNYEFIQANLAPFITAEVQNVMLNISHQFIAEDDILYYNRILDNDAYRHYMAATIESVSNTMDFVGYLGNKISDWLKVNHPEKQDLLDNIQKILSAIQKLK